MGSRDPGGHDLVGQSGGLAQAWPPRRQVDQGDRHRRGAGWQVRPPPSRPVPVGAEAQRRWQAAAASGAMTAERKPLAKMADEPDPEMQSLSIRVTVRYTAIDHAKLARSARRRGEELSRYI